MDTFSKSNIECKLKTKIFKISAIFPILITRKERLKSLLVNHDRFCSVPKIEIILQFG